MSYTEQVLPKEAYFDTDWFEDEKSKIFEKEWQFISMKEDLQSDGSYLLETIGNTPIVVLNNGGEISAFVNMCRHRGMQLINGSEKLTSSINCPYHNWVYGLDGKLKGVPQAKSSFPDMDKSCMGLIKVKCEIWQGMVFVNLDSGAPDLHTVLNPIKDRILPYDDISSLDLNDGYKYIINANWKIFVENYMDVYHLFHIHKESLKEYDHKGSDFEFVNDQWLFYEPLSDEGSKASGWWDSYYSTIDSFNGKRGAYVSMLFPNFGITATENMCLFIDIKPISSSETEITVHVKSSGGSKNVKTPLVYDYKNGKMPINKLLAKPDVMNEDIYACEMIQKNLKSPHYKVGALAQEYEKPLYDYQSIVQRKMSKG